MRRGGLRGLLVGVLLVGVLLLGVLYVGAAGPRSVPSWCTAKRCCETTPAGLLGRCLV